MITTIRSQFKQATYRYVVFFMVFLIAASMISSMLVKSDRMATSWAVKINGSEISYHDFNREVAKQTEYLTQLRAQYGQYADLLFQSMGWSLDPKTRALEMLIKEELIVQYGKQLGIEISQSYISRVINDASFVRQHLGHIVPPFAFDQTGILDMNVIKAFLKQNGISTQQFEERIERALIQMQVIELVAAAHHTPLFDVKQHYIAKKLAKQFSYLSFAFDTFLAEEKKKPLSDDDLKVFYDAQNTQFRRYWVPEKRTAAVWKFDAKNYNVVISDEQIEEYYEDNKVKNYVLDPLKVEVQKIAFKELTLPEGMSFEDVRKDLVNNADSAWAKQWKTMKPFARGEYPGELEKNAFVLQNEGEVSPVFETNEGPVILKLVKRIPRTYKPLSAVKNDIKTLLLNKAFKKRFIGDIKEMIRNNTVESFVLEKAAKKEIVPGIAKDDTKLAQEIFGLKKGEYSVYLDNNTGVIVMLSDIAERYLPDLSSIKDVVKNDMYEKRAQDAMVEDVTNAEKAATTQSFAELQKTFGGILNQTPLVNPEDHKKMHELDSKGLPIREMMYLEKQGSFFVAHDERNSYLIKLDALEEFDENKFQLVKSEIENQWGSFEKRLFVDSFVASLQRNATIETNESIITLGEEYSE